MHRVAIFQDEYDYSFLLGTLQYYAPQLHYDVVAYCLMPNHIHLLIKTGDISISQIMQVVLGHYAKRYNLRHHFTGHLFESVFHSELIKDVAYLLNAVKYIHLNPVKAKLADFPDEYPYSSYNAYAWNEFDHLIDTEFLYTVFQETSDQIKTFYDFQETFIQFHMAQLTLWDLLHAQNRTLSFTPSVSL